MKLSIFNNLNESKINSLFILSFVFLFPVIALINFIFEIQNGSVSQTYRFLNLSFALFLILKNILNKKNKILKFNTFRNVALLLFLLFWCLYLLRIFFDLQIHNLHLLTSLSKNYYYLYSIGVTFIPILAIISMNKIDYNYLEKILLKYLKIIGLCFLIILIIDKFYANHLVGRFTLTRNKIDYLDSISIAIISSLLLILSSINLTKSIYNYLFFFLGWFLLLSTAARGAIIFTILTYLFLIFYRKKEIKLNYLYFFIVISLAALTNYIASLFFKNNFGGNNILLYRISHVTSEDSTVTRLKILKDALYQFIDQPFFGSHFLVVESKMYAHNIVLDALISTGIIGSILLLPIFYLFFKNLLNKTIPIFLVLLGLFYFLNTLTSGAIYNIGEFWMFFILIVNYNFNKIDNKLITNEL